MLRTEVAPPFPAAIHFPDVEPSVLAREEDNVAAAVVALPRPEFANTPLGMARFLLLKGVCGARDSARGLRNGAATLGETERAMFWDAVLDEIDAAASLG